MRRPKTKKNVPTKNASKREDPSINTVETLPDIESWVATYWLPISFP
jgi:hypothetical protein